MDRWPGQTNQIRGEQIEFQVGFYDWCYVPLLFMRDKQSTYEQYESQIMYVCGRIEIYLNEKSFALSQFWIHVEVYPVLFLQGSM